MAKNDILRVNNHPDQQVKTARICRNCLHSYKELDGVLCCCMNHGNKEVYGDYDTCALFSPERVEQN